MQACCTHTSQRLPMQQRRSLSDHIAPLQVPRPGGRASKRGSDHVRSRTWRRLLLDQVGNAALSSSNPGKQDLSMVGPGVGPSTAPFTPYTVYLLFKRTAPPEHSYTPLRRSWRACRQPARHLPPLVRLPPPSLSPHPKTGHLTAHQKTHLQRGR